MWLGVTEVDLPTPRYNRSLAVDQAMACNEQARMEALEGHQAVSEGIMLLKVWLRQRGLDQVCYFTTNVTLQYIFSLLKCDIKNST